MNEVVGDALTYYVALRLLGQSKSRLVTLLDGVATAGLTVWAAGALTTGKDAAAPLGVLQLKDEVVRLGHQAASWVSDQRSGLSRFARSERLAAAHAVLVVSSYFEALGDADLPVPAERLALTSAEQAALATGGAVPTGYTGLIEFLLREPLPMPEPHRSYADVRLQLGGCYGRLSSRLLKFISGLAVWDDLSDTARDAVREVIAGLAPVALERYDDGYRRLAVDNREFEVWASLNETHALGAGLSGMSALLAEMSARQPGRRPRTHLMRSYQAALEDPVIGSGQAPDGVVLPSLAEAYITPVCRVAEIAPGDTPADGEWWQSRELVADTESFLAGYLTSPRAVRAPLVVLGEPGSGKSKLAEILAARLPADDFLPVLVELRDVAAESMVLEQIEQAIYQRPGERVSWHDLIENAEGALPVVLLDGFDELIQATSVNRYDYLEQVRDFQHRQAQIGCPVAVLVTSRTVVADQARFPSGSLALQLQPFTEEQVRRWLEVWDRCNAEVLAGRGLRPLPVATALAHRELAEQPLLLLLVAIFDAADNSLQRGAARFGRAELYERLLSDFALREISKSAANRALRADLQHQLVAREMQRLAVVALAMFTRGQQTATEADLNQDLPVLFPGDEPGTSSPDADLTPAQRATGRFFFIHKSEARLRDERARSYEFLHSTFGEFLVARAALTALRDLADYREVMRRGTTAAGDLDDGFLYATLSFSCLASRVPIISFMRELFRQLPHDDHARYRGLLRELITGSLYLHPSRSFHHYEPAHPPLHRRVAAYSANLVLMLVLLSGEVSATEFCGPVDTAKTWAQYGYLWRSGLTSSEWRSLTDAIRAHPSRNGGPVEITLTPEDGSPVSPADSLVITEQSEGLTTFDVHVSAHPDITYEAGLPHAGLAGRIFRELTFTPSWHTGMLLLQEIPFLQATGGEIRFQAADGTLALPGYMLAHLDYSRSAPPQERIQLYDSYASTMTADDRLLEQFLLRLQQETHVIPPDIVISLLRKVNTLSPSETYLAIMNHLWRESAPDGTREQLATLVRDIRLHWPDNPLDTLDIDLRGITYPNSG
jgi:hypothetical protein